MRIFETNRVYGQRYPGHCTLCGSGSVAHTKPGIVSDDTDDRWVPGNRSRHCSRIVVSFALAEGSRFVVDPRRMNVAMSRARRKLVLVGDFQSLDRELQNAGEDPRLAHLRGLVALFGPGGALSACRRTLTP